MPLSNTVALAVAGQENADHGAVDMAARSRASRQTIEISLLDLQILLTTRLLSSEASGAAIVDELHRSGRPIRWESRVYAALDRLERDGLINRQLREQNATRRRGQRRSTIALTPSGRLVLGQSLRIIDRLRQDREPAKVD